MAAFPPDGYPNGPGYYHNNCTNPITPPGLPSAGKPCQIMYMDVSADGYASVGHIGGIARFAYGHATDVRTNGMSVTADFFACIRPPIVNYNNGQGAGESLYIDHNYYCGEDNPHAEVAFWEIRDGDFKPYDSGVNEGWSLVGSGTIDSNGEAFSSKVGSTGKPGKPEGSFPGPHPDWDQVCWLTGLIRWEGWVVTKEMLVLTWDMEGY